MPSPGTSCLPRRRKISNTFGMSSFAMPRPLSRMWKVVSAGPCSAVISSIPSRPGPQVFHRVIQEIAHDLFQGGFVRDDPRQRPHGHRYFPLFELVCKGLEERANQAFRVEGLGSKLPATYAGKL